MEDPSITKRLIDFGTEYHEYHEVQDIPEESNNHQQQQQQQQQLLTNINNSNNNTSSSSTNQQQSSTSELPPELPPPKQKNSNSSKASKQKSKSKSKSKIPRSPSHASFLSNSNSNNNSSSGGGNYPASPPPQISAIPPQTPPLPASYQNKAKHMNGGGGGSSSNVNSNNSNTSAATPTTTTTNTESKTIGPVPVPAAATPPLNNNNNSNVGANTGGGLMGGGVVQVVGSGGGGVNGANANVAANRGSVNLASARRPQIQISSPIVVAVDASPKHFQYLTMTVRKDENGYGMKVSGDNPVFVESVKPGGAAQIAGLVAGDMILKVNGQEVRSEKHPTVVSLIKASTIVELAVKRSHKMARPTSVGIVPSTPILSGRDRTASITGPQPVDSIKRREMETYKIQTLQKMLEQEKLNLERLKGETNNPSYKLSEANIRKLREQLRQVGAEDAPPPSPPSNKFQAANNKQQQNIALLSPNQIHHLSASAHHHFQPQQQQQLHHPLHYHQQQQQHHLHHLNQQQPLSPPQQQPSTPQTSSSPAFLSLLPRSLSSLSLGGRRNKIDKDLITSPLNNTTDFLHISTTSNNNNNNTNMSQSLHQPQLLRNSPQQQQLFYQQQFQQQQRLKDTPTKSNNSSAASGTASNSKHKNKYAAQVLKNQAIQEDDIPPPLPQRNPPRQLSLDTSNNNISSSNHNNVPSCSLFSPISDLDHTTIASPQRNSPQPPGIVTSSPQSAAVAGSASAAAAAAATAAQKKRSSKSKTKALSDPKMSTQMFLQMETSSAAGLHGSHRDATDSEVDCVPPPLPPRQAGMLEEAQIVTLRGSFSNLNASSKAQLPPPPNSIETLLNYPLVSTCTAVHRDNMAAAFPLSQRPNIVQQLQQHQQQQQQQLLSGGQGGQGAQATGATTGAGGAAAALGQTPHNLSHMSKHRRVVSSPENMHPRHPDRHHKTTSGSWELVEKDGEITPPGTPPPPYLTAHQHHAANMSAGGSGNNMDDSRDSVTTPIFVESHHFTPLAAMAASGAASPPPIPSATQTSRIQAAQSSATQKEIISMEDEDASDGEGPFIDENGPFNYLQRLLEAENVAFLAVFLNYVLSNSEPAPLLFYLITGLYKEGTAKDMRKWAYEIHSTFLVPRAPLAWYRQDESLAREVDNVLQSEFDKVEILRKVFWKSRKRARDIICEQLREFQQKRTAGLGTIYGPTDAQLSEAKGDKQREQHIFEETLLRKLQSLIEEYEKDLPIEDPRKLALCSALSTVIHRIFITRSHPNSIVDRVHHFVSREKSFKSRLMGKNRKMIVRGHPLVLRQYYEVTHCNHCQTIIWGVSPQGYHCTDCKLNIHRPCSKVLDENCPGPLPQAKRTKDPHNDNKISKLMGKIRPRNSNDFIASEKRARHEEDFDPADFNNERLHSTSIVRQPSDRRPDAGNISLRANGNAAAASSSSAAHNTSSDLQSSFHGSSNETEAASVAAAAAALAAGGGGAGTAASAAAALAAAAETNALDADGGKDARRERLHQQHQQNKSAPVSVNRSESYKERLSHKRNRNSRRKTSDPSLTSRPNDEQPDLGLSNSNYTASSNSSLSSGGGSESPSTSMEQVGGAGAGAAAAVAGAHSHSQHHHAHAHHPPHAHQHSHQDSFHSTGSGSTSTNANNISFWGGSIGGPGGPTIGQLARQWNFESDEDDDLNEADWSSNVAAQALAELTDAEKKRQEIINEIYQTERSHVRTLKLLDRLFYCPLQDSNILTDDHLTLLFSPPALHSLRELHGAFEQQIKQRRIEHQHIVQHVGDLLASMFDGPAGEDLREYAAAFCARQQIALEALKEKRRKDEQLQKLLSKAESHKACRRLQLKDLLPTVLQRLTKYPLLFENLYKVTVRVVPENTTEAEAIQRALESSKKILVDVNQAVKTAEDAHKLQNIQRKLDKSTVDKEEFKNLDLTQYRLIHDGSLVLKKNPSIQLHGLLFENMIVLLTKQDDKYSLKYLHAARNTEVNNKPVSPIMNIDSETLVRQEAADKNSFFLIKTKTSQMLELRAPSSSECKTWFKHISDAAEQYKPRSKNANNHEPVDDPAIATLPHSNTKETLDALTPERPPPLAATATMTTTPLAPMMMMPQSGQATPIYNNNNEVMLRNGRRESTPTGVENNGSASGGAYQKQRMSHQHELLSTPASVNRTMSTRSCGAESNNNNYSGAIDNNNLSAVSNGVTLRHTQSARQANAAGDDSQNAAVAALLVSGGAGGGSKRDSASIVYSNNSNNTRTLMQSSPPLVEPTAIQISISPAHTAEPVLTPAERLRRLDARIRDGLLEKQKIICDMFRLPVEHFHEIVDIAAMPEAPKDSADIALAAYAQVQSLTEVLNEYMHVTPEQQISAVSTAVCDQCHEKQRQSSTNSNSFFSSSSASASSAANTTTTSQISVAVPPPPPMAVANVIDDNTPPPLPPPNKTPPLRPNVEKSRKSKAQAQQQTPAPAATRLHTPAHAFDEANAADIHEDDDGYCEIDELRLPALPLPAKAKALTPPPPPPLPAGTFKTPAPPPPLSPSASAAAASTTATPAELVKRQSTISADSIPEESADEVTQAINEGNTTLTTAATTAADSAAAEQENPKESEQQKDKTPVAENAETAVNVKEQTVEECVPEKMEHNNNDKAEDEDEKSAAAAIVVVPLAKFVDADDDDADADIDIGCDADADIVAADVASSTTLTSATSAAAVAEPQTPQGSASASAATAAAAANTAVEPLATAETLLGSGEVNNDVARETLSTLNKLNAALSMVDGMTQTLPLPLMFGNAVTTRVNGAAAGAAPHCGPNRIQHANSLEPSVPCHALNSIVSALNAQISLLLPKINERDMERERLRRENQHLRDLLNAMHDRQRVEDKLETPTDITTTDNTNADDKDETDGATASSTSTLTTAEIVAAVAAATSDAEAEN